MIYDFVVTNDPAPTILIAEPIAQEPRAWIDQHAHVIDMSGEPRSSLLAQLSNVHGLIVRTYTIVDAELLACAPQLRVIARAGVGLDNIDLQACRDHGVRVVHTPAANAGAVIEYVTQMMLSSIRSIDQIARLDASDSRGIVLTESNWHTIRERAISPRSCVGLRLGIIGLGQIGSKLARVASALGMEVVYTDLREIPHDQRAGGTPRSLEELAQTSDVISVHVDGRASNHHTLSSAFFSGLNSKVIMLNTSRGFVIDEPSMIQFAESNPQSRFIIDVHNPEPIAPHSTILSQPNIITTPHIASATRDAKEQMSWVVRDALAVIKGDNPEFEVVLPKH